MNHGPGLRWFPMANPTRVLAKWCMFAGLLSVLVLAQPALARKKSAPPPVPNLGGLLASDVGDWMAALEDLRKDPAKAREVLVQALRSNLESDLRWRVYHHLAEFATQEDLPDVVEKLGQVEDPREKQALRGAALALYRPSPKADDLSFAISGFSFIGRNAPRAIRNSDEDKLVINNDALDALNRLGLPLEVLEKVKLLRGRRFSERVELSDALKNALGEEIWARHGALVVEQIQPDSPQAELAGSLRVEMRNPRPGPILVEFQFDAWSGRFSKDPPPTLLFIEGEQTGRIEIPVEMVWRQNQALRVDMRMREVNGQSVPVYQKLFFEG